MTRSERKVSVARRFPAVALVLAATLSVTPAMAEPTAGDGFSEQVATDPVSGIALFGYDPVGYFVEGAPVPGRGDLEVRWRGTVWRFASHANREAFFREPEVFAPAYGGYDAEGVARGVAALSDPTFFLVSGNRLFLFRSRESLERFSPEDIVAADAAWPRVRASLRP